MSRTSEGPWFRSGRGWYAKIAGQQICLVKTTDRKDSVAKREAKRAWLRLTTERRGAVSAETLEACLRDKLARLVGDKGPDDPTYKATLATFEDLLAVVGSVKLADLRKHMVTDWLNGKDSWNGSTRALALRRIVAAINAWVAGGRLDVSPLMGIRRPKSHSRAEEVYLPPELRQRAFDSIKDNAFRNFFLAIVETGCRPGEVASVTADDVDLGAGIWRLEDHKTVDRTDRAKVVILSPKMAELTGRLVAVNKVGPLFRNLFGESWKPSAWASRFATLRRRLGCRQRLIAYSARHSFVTDLLVEMDADAVGEITGQSAQTIRQHYSHLAEKQTELRAKMVEARKGIELSE